MLAEVAFEAGLLEYLSCLLVPQHEIQVAHGDVNGLGEFLHFYFYAQVLAFGQGVGNVVYYPELFEVFQDVPVGVLFFRDDPYRHSLVKEDIDSTAFLLD